MGTFLIRRLLYGLVTIILISMMTFFIFNVIPGGDPAKQIAGKNATPELVEQINEEYGFDKPKPVQYLNTMKKILNGSIVSYSTGLEVVPLVKKAIPVTFSLMLIASTIWLAIGVSAGIYGAVRPGTKLDGGMTIFMLVGISFPTIWLAVMLLFLFTVKIPIFPPGSYMTIYEGGFLGWLYHLILPAMTLVLVSMASYALVSRTNMRGAMKEEWVKTAVAKGIDPDRVFIHHIFRIGVIPIVIMFGLDLAASLAGAIFTEVIFGLPGLGSVVRTGIDNLDFPILLVMTLFGATLIVIANIVVDVVQAMLDPRIRLA
jgi:peptide/nickel transport system permease protein